MKWTKGTRVRYIGTDKAYYGKTAIIMASTNDRQPDIKFEHNGKETFQSDIEIMEACDIGSEPLPILKY